MFYGYGLLVERRQEHNNGNDSTGFEGNRTNGILPAPCQREKNRGRMRGGRRREKFSPRSGLWNIQSFSKHQAVSLGINMIGRKGATDEIYCRRQTIHLSEEIISVSNR